MNPDDWKRAAAAAALDLVTPSMTVGLGTGSTAAAFIALLGARVRAGLDIAGVATSEATRALAYAAGIDTIEPDETTVIDLAVDGADEIDPGLQLLKGGGGALLREKIIARAARRFVVIADGSKKVAQLGRFPLAVEIDPAFWSLTVRQMRETLHREGYPHADVRLRGALAGPAFQTDGGHYVIDCALGRITDAAALDAGLAAIPGVIETGFFLRLADDAFIAGAGGVEHLNLK